MVTTVKLQAPFEYSWIVTLATIVLGIIAGLILGPEAGKLAFLGTLLTRLLTMVVAPLVLGLLICSDMNSTDVQWSFQGIGTPMGVATYNNIRIKDALPSKKQLEERMLLLQKELQHAKRLINKKNSVSF